MINAVDNTYDISKIMKSAHAKARRAQGCEWSADKSYRELFAEALRETWAIARDVMATRRAFASGNVIELDPNTARQVSTDGRLAA